MTGSFYRTRAGHDRQFLLLTGFFRCHFGSRRRSFKLGSRTTVLQRCLSSRAATSSAHSSILSVAPPCLEVSSRRTLADKAALWHRQHSLEAQNYWAAWQEAVWRWSLLSSRPAVEV